MCLFRNKYCSIEFSIFKKQMFFSSTGIWPTQFHRRENNETYHKVKYKKVREENKHTTHNKESLNTVLSICMHLLEDETIMKVKSKIHILQQRDTPIDIRRLSKQWRSFWAYLTNVCHITPIILQI